MTEATIRSDSIRVRIAPDERKIMEAGARAVDRKLSDYIRTAALEAARRDAKKRKE